MLLKEYKHIIRDKFTVIVGLGLPAALVIFFGFIIELNYNNIGLFVKDDSKTRESREFVEAFYSSGYFNVKYIDSADTYEYIRSNATSAVMVIPYGFGKNAAQRKQSNVQIVIDGSDNAKTGLILSYLGGIVNLAADRIYNEQTLPAEIRTRFLFNPELNSKWFVVPGLIVVIIGLMSILLTSLTIAKEWEKGSMELLLSTHISPFEIVIGKLSPYFILSLAGAVSVFIIARTVFGVPFTGNIFIFWIACCIYIISCLSWGVLISAVTRQQQLAMMAAMVTGLLPSMLLSGFIFPVENMPLFFKIVTFVLPQRWFMEVCRGTFLRGAEFVDLLLPLAMLCLFCAFVITLAGKKFKTDVEP